MADFLSSRRAELLALAGKCFDCFDGEGSHYTPGTQRAMHNHLTTLPVKIELRKTQLLPD